MNKRKRKKESQKITFYTPETGWITVRVSAQERRRNAYRFEKSLDILVDTMKKYKGIE